MILNSHLVTTRGEIGEAIHQLTIQNPTYLNNLRLGFSNRGVPEYLELFTENEFGELIVPRNAPVVFDDNFQLLRDERSKGFPIDVSSRITLTEEQIPAVQAVMENGDGILQAGTGKGKSVMACEIISRFKRTTMILVHKEFLMDQFTGHLKNWLGLTDDEIGYARGNPNTWTWKDRKVVIGMLQSLNAHEDNLPEGFKEHFGLVVVDECHRVAASTFSAVIQLFNCYKRLGLTATPKRSDGLEIVFHFHLGRILYKLMGVNMKPKVKIARTIVEKEQLGDIYQGRAKTDISLAKLVTQLSTNEDRNRLILKNLVAAAKSGRRIIILSDRRGHSEYLRYIFEEEKDAHGLENIQTRMYVGGMKQPERQEAERNGHILFATFQMAKEGLDIPELDTLFLVTPNSAEITIEQSVGRIARSAPNKKNPLVVDFYDTNIGICNAMFNKRMKVYSRLEMEVS